MIKFLLRNIAIVFWLLVATDLAAILLNNSSLVFIVKPLLIPVLMLYLFSIDRITCGKKLILSGLFFSWLGDVFLLFDNRNALFFIAGLISFLITHVCYIVYFLSIQSPATSLLKKRPVYILLTACYGVGLVCLLFPYLGQLALPVMVYATVICSMLLCSLHVYLKTTKPSNQYFIAGAALFVLSDSLLAVNKFYQPLPLAGVWIMLTYCAAQYFIVKGVLNINAPAEVDKV